MEGQLLERLRLAEERLRQLEYEIQVLKQQAGRESNNVNLFRNAGT